MNTVSNISDKVDDERSHARAISEILIRLGSLEGELHAIKLTLRNIDAEHERGMVEFRQSVKSVRTSVGRAVAASQRIAKIQDEVIHMQRKLDTCG